MMTFDEALANYAIERTELCAWIEQSWVRPVKTGESWQFDDGDIARLELICELRRGMEINDDALPVVLSLLDQLYAARQTLLHVRDALAQLPDPTLADVLARVQAELDKS